MGERQFFARLNRARGNDSKAQYARIQASYLEHAGFVAEAEDLLNLILTQWPSKFETASVHLQKATCALKSEDVDSALTHFQAALLAEAEYPSVKTQAFLEFAKTVALHRRAELYDEAIAIIAERSDGILFPIDRFYTEAVLAMIKAEKGEKLDAAEHAKAALEATRETHSGFRYHARIGLATDPDEAFHEAVARIAGYRRDA